MQLVVDTIRGRAVKQALDLLRFINHKGAPMLIKVLNSAVSNAKNKGYAEDGLFISKIVSNCGPVMKRHRAASFGRACVIRKRTAHVSVELDSAEKIVKNVAVK